MAKQKQNGHAEAEKFHPPSLLNLRAALPMSAPAEAVQAFDAETGGERGSVPTGLPVVRINHDEQAFVLPSGELVDSIEGHMIHWFGTFRWYESPYRPGNHAPPDCFSGDMIAPHPSSLKPQAKLCRDCRWRQWGSSRNGTRAPDCAEFTWTFLLNPAFGSPPMVCLVSPPTSIPSMKGGQFKSGVIGQAESRCGRYELAWVKFKLEKVQGAKHCILKPEILGIQTLKDEAVQLGLFKRNFRDRMEGMRQQAPQLTQQPAG